MQRSITCTGCGGRIPPSPPCCGPYPHPPVSHEPRMHQFVEDLRGMGLHPFDAPSGVMLDEQQMAFSRCRGNRCDGFPCLVHAKSDAEVLGIRPALGASTLSLLTRAELKRLHTEAAAAT
jgi:hypothetical protein